MNLQKINKFELIIKNNNLFEILYINPIELFLDSFTNKLYCKNI
jgi:hypothetical protein